MVESYVEKRKFTPKNRPIRQVYIDDGAIRQSDIDRVKDIVLVETMDIDEFKNRFKDDSLFDIE